MGFEHKTDIISIKFHKINLAAGLNWEVVRQEKKQETSYNSIIIIQQRSNGDLDQSDSSEDGQKSHRGKFLKAEPIRFLDRLNLV